MGKVARCATLKENERDTRVSCVSLRVRGRICARPMIIDRKRKVIGRRNGSFASSSSLRLRVGKRVSEIAENDATRSCTYKFTWLCTCVYLRGARARVRVRYMYRIKVLDMPAETRHCTTTSHVSPCDRVRIRVAVASRSFEISRYRRLL